MFDGGNGGGGEPIHFLFLLIHNMWICVVAAATHLRDWTDSHLSARLPPAWRDNNLLRIWRRHTFPLLTFICYAVAIAIRQLTSSVTHAERDCWSGAQLQRWQMNLKGAEEAVAAVVVAAAAEATAQQSESCHAALGGDGAYFISQWDVSEKVFIIFFFSSSKTTSPPSRRHHFVPWCKTLAAGFSENGTSSPVNRELIGCQTSDAASQDSYVCIQKIHLCCCL